MKIGNSCLQHLQKRIFLEEIGPDIHNFYKFLVVIQLLVTEVKLWITGIEGSQLILVATHCLKLVEVTGALMRTVHW